MGEMNKIRFISLLCSWKVESFSLFFRFPLGGARLSPFIFICLSLSLPIFIYKVVIFSVAVILVIFRFVELE